MQSTKERVPFEKEYCIDHGAERTGLRRLCCLLFQKTDGQNSAADTTQAGLANADTGCTEINKDGKEIRCGLWTKGKNHAYEINKNGEKG